MPVTTDLRTLAADIVARGPATRGCRDTYTMPGAVCIPSRAHGEAMVTVVFRAADGWHIRSYIGNDTVAQDALAPVDATLVTVADAALAWIA
jgi:hypothetical protein